jgi:hypothetical protein
MEKGLFYSENDRILFGITSTAYDGDNVDEIIKMLEEKKVIFCEAGGEGNIKTMRITHSDRYKSMRVFYCETTNVPENAFILDGEWTMMKWLTTS